MCERVRVRVTLGYTYSELVKTLSSNQAYCSVNIHAISKYYTSTFSQEIGLSSDIKVELICHQGAEGHPN